jgi:pimeloyl-ACP methyl ester carboxylesterase
MPIAPHVVLIHGLGRTRFDMGLLAHRLRRRFPETTVHTFGYASRRLTLDQATKELAHFVRLITTTAPVSFVGHSLGGIVVRSLDLSNETRPPLHRLVTLGSPHGGATIARALARYRAPRAIFGPILSELGTLELLHAPQEIEIGCIVGATGTRIGFLPLLGGDNDGLVLRGEARFPGCRDEIALCSFHGTMPFSARLAVLAGEFLERGRFTTASNKSP